MTELDSTDKYRTFWPRFAALLIDGFIMLPLGILDSWFRDARFPPAFFYVWVPLSALVYPVYTIAMHAKFGQTLGKMALGVRVLDLSEEPLKFNQAVLRDAPQLVFNLAGIYLGLAFLGLDPKTEPVKSTTDLFATVAAVWALADIVTFFYNAKRRALHDYLAGTVVVRVKGEDEVK